jgi:hypothetical protein
MAKNVQIIPDSGILDFLDSDVSKIKMEYDSVNTKLVTSAGDTTLLEVSDGLVNVGNSAKLVLPVVAGNPPGASTGDLWFNSSSNKLSVYGNSGVEEGGGTQGPVGAQGPIGDIGPLGPKGNTGAQGPLGPKGDTGAQGPIGNIGPKGVIGPIGPIGDIGPIGPLGPKEIQEHKVPLAISVLKA